jgi:hypothetical protein
MSLKQKKSSTKKGKALHSSESTDEINSVVQDKDKGKGESLESSPVSAKKRKGEKSLTGKEKKPYHPKGNCEAIGLYLLLHILSYYTNRIR